MGQIVVRRVERILDIERRRQERLESLVARRALELKRANASRDRREAQEATRRERLRRRAFWRWSRDPRRTMSEILQGPPDVRLTKGSGTLAMPDVNGGRNAGCQP